MSDAEQAAVDNLAAVTSSLTRFGLDSGDKQKWDRLASAVAELELVMPTEPPICEDTRLVGDWELIGCTSYELVSKKGITGLGAAPFTNLGAVHCSFTAQGQATAKETLEFFGKPVILNELRGVVTFSDDGDAMQESYDSGDLGGQQNSPVFQGLTFTLLESAITSCGTLRLGRDDDVGVYVWRKLKPGGLANYHDEQMLPGEGGTYLGNPTWQGPVERA